jgi:hypothetical protein
MEAGGTARPGFTGRKGVPWKETARIEEESIEAGLSFG